MAAVTRQPFAPLQHSRLQLLKSLKNRQNAPSSPTSPSKRKAEAFNDLDVENVDPIMMKRSKACTSKPSMELLKPALRYSLSAPNVCTAQGAQITTPRRVLQPHSVTTSSSTHKPSPLSTSSPSNPSRTRRAPGTARHIHHGPYSRSEKERSAREASPPFSLDAALKGTLPPHGRRSKPSSCLTGSKSLPHAGASETKSSWFFDIHEDTPDQEMTNMIQHGTCVLDISSEQDFAKKARREQAEGRDKENIPPPDYVADILTRPSRRRACMTAADCARRVARRDALAEMKAADFYSEGCDETSIFIVPADEELPAEEPRPESDALLETDPLKAVELLMATQKPPKVVLEPLAGTGDSFDVWESGSSKDEDEA
ncbi:hypothetical protein CDD82_4746 [Ophiocordyceps australis]|uniref:Uncharacterized protein n=1 Tax=Ophiocordyceps australis TaxID=1399860 RepID=A0A2C5Z4T5_9HYPO|nr:hypothetical protein CDD82_4746 [Ophiocordyceps australis]